MKLAALACPAPAHAITAPAATKLKTLPNLTAHLE